MSNDESPSADALGATAATSGNGAAANESHDDDKDTAEQKEQQTHGNVLAGSNNSSQKGRARRRGRGNINRNRRKGKDGTNPGAQPNQHKPDAAGGGGGGRVRNSYLKIVVDDASVDLLHGTARRIRQEVRQRFPDVPKDDETGDAKEGSTKASADAADNTDEPPPDDKDQPPPKQQKRRPPRPLTFKPRSRDSLHMTFFFGGTTICEIPPEELMEWHDKVMARLQQASENTDDNSGDDAEASRYTLQFRGLSLFPPGRNTLVVGIFDGSPELHRLHNDLRDIARNSNSDGLKEVVQRSKKRWTVHVTLGDLHGGGRGDAKKETLKELGKMLEVGIGLEALGEQDESTNPPSFTAKVWGVAMGGPVPPQVELKWDHFFI